VLVVAFFAAPAMADCTGSTMADFNAGDMSFGAWPANMNLDFVSSGEQKAFAFWYGDAANALDVKKDQTAGMLYQAGFPIVECGCEAADQSMWDTRVINIEKISSGNQFATATGYATAKNSISVCSSQGTAAGCDC
jgi:hypothetical protein